MIVLAVAGAGALGVLARYGLTALVPGAGMTLAVNVAGSLALGALIGAGAPGDVRTVAGAGFLGGFTTFSTFAVQAWERGPGGGTALVAASVVLGVAAAGAGIALGRAL